MPFQTGNPFIDALMGGGNPSVMDFLNPLNQGGLPQGIMPGEQAGIPAGQSPGLGAGLDSFLQRPGGLMLLNLLAQEGSGPMPGSPLGAIGRAGVATSQQLNRNRLVEAQTGLSGARAKALEQASGPGGVGANVQTSFKGANGNMWIITRDGQSKDLGVPFNENIKFFEQPDKSVIGVDSSSGERIGTVISPEESRAATTRQAQTQAATELPQALAGLDATTRKVGDTIRKVKEAIEDVGPLSTGVIGAATRGIPGTPAFNLQAQVETINANLGFDELTSMRAASKTGGALGQVSERELSLLIAAKQNLNTARNDEDLLAALNGVVTHYNNYIREIEVMKNALREQAGQGSAEVRIDFRTLPRRDE